MLMNEYVVEKLRELDEHRLTQAVLKQEAKVVRAKARRTKPLIGPVMLLAGRTLRRAGEGLEGWGAPGPPEGDQRWAERHTG